MPSQQLLGRSRGALAQFWDLSGGLFSLEMVCEAVVKHLAVRAQVPWLS
jgi:hypothetical protein